jgi:hypothetical protein
VTVPLTAPPQAIETTADPAALRAMVAKTAAAWETVGETAPHHSVLTCDEYRPERFAENEVSFFESGKHDLALILAHWTASAVRRKAFVAAWSLAVASAG